MPLLDDFSSLSAVFNEGHISSGKPLKDKDALREAFVINELSHLPQKALKEFAKSPEAKTMLENEIISYDSLQNLVNDAYGDRATEFCVCHLAKENEDPIWDELVRHREEERRLMNALIARYGEEAKPHAKYYRENWINNSIPKRYLTGESETRR